MISNFLRVVALVTCAAAAANAQRLIGEGDAWRYFKGSSFPPAQGPLNWTQPGYNDSGWGLPAPSGFGYGDGDDATPLTDMEDNYASVYLRTAFTVSDPAALSHLTLAVDYDDGFVAYLNGVVIARRNVPAGALSNTTLALGSHEASRGNASGAPQEKEFIAIDRLLLVSGANVLAIEGHNVSLGSSDFSLIPELYAGVNLLRGPYLQTPTAGAMTIVWRTDALTNSAVDWGLDANYTGGTVADAALVTEHEITIPSLQPNQTYFYRVRSGGVTLASATFRSVPADNQPFRFSVVGDFGYATVNTTNIANRIADSNCDLLLTVGDNIYDPVGSSGTGQPGVYDRYWFMPYAATMRRAPIYPALGNHDIETANGSWYLSYFRLPQNGPSTERERNYWFDYGDAHFAVIDANPFVNPFDPARSAVIKNWLATDLAATTRRWKFVFFHQPAYTSSGNGTHDPATVLQSEIQPICAQYGVQMVFQGHNHWYERINPINGVNYIVTGAGGRGLTDPTFSPTYSAVLNRSVFSFTQVDINGGQLTLREIDASGTQIDTFSLNLDHPFAIDGLLDSALFQRASNPNGLKLYAAIRGNLLYVATQDAGEKNDHFIYLNNQSASLRNANWSKAGQVMSWAAFLADENDTGFNGWLDASEQPLTDPAKYAAMTSGLNNNGTTGNGVLEGTIDLRAHFGSFPGQLYLAAAPFASPNGGALISGAQVPIGNGDGDVQPNEFLVLNPRDIALDLPTSDAGQDGSVEAGMQVGLSGSGTAPSGLPISFHWTQLSGPTGMLTNGDTPAASFVATVNVLQGAPAIFQLRVNDTRFNTDDTVTVQVFPMIDSDGDGLSDQEELTGMNNILTTANPAGQVTNPNLADTDGDGMNDGDEALAGTNPNSAASVFRISAIEEIGNNVQITFASVAGRQYRMQSAPEVSGSWIDMGDPVMASGSVTSITAASIGPRHFYRVRLGP